MADWQPIETAPRDGTQLLLFGKWRPFDILPGGQDCIVIASWSTYSSVGGAPREWIGASNVNADFTHWMPLPPTPDRSGEADKTVKQGLAEGESGLPEGPS